jgi:putative transposase
MAHTHICAYLHTVFSTKHRTALIVPDLQPRLWEYLGGIARDHKFKALAVGGIEDHAHVLISLPATISIAKAVQVLKGVSSKWVHDLAADNQAFAWQEGYGAFSVGYQELERTIAYIRNQVQHHRHQGYQEELCSLLRQHGMSSAEALRGE